MSLRGIRQGNRQEAQGQPNTADPDSPERPGFQQRIDQGAQNTRDSQDRINHIQYRGILGVDIEWDEIMQIVENGGTVVIMFDNSLKVTCYPSCTLEIPFGRTAIIVDGVEWGGM